MALPNSGQISFNDVRTEMSQSSLSNYAFSEWAAGSQFSTYYPNSGVYTPINYLSSGSRWSLSGNPVTMSKQNLSMSAWYGYDRTLYISSSVTGTLQSHFTYDTSIIPSTMLIIDAGTSNTTWSINISGSNNYGVSRMYVFYGKPWSNNGSGSGSTTTITESLSTPLNLNFNYNYTYDSNKGQYLYFVILPDYT